MQAGFYIYFSSLANGTYVLFLDLNLRCVDVIQQPDSGCAGDVPPVGHGKKSGLHGSLLCAARAGDREAHKYVPSAGSPPISLVMLFHHHWSHVCIVVIGGCRPFVWILELLYPSK